MTLHFLNDLVINDVEFDTKIASLKSELTCNLINRIFDLRFLKSSLPGYVLRMHLESANLSKPCLVNLISKDTHLVFLYICSRHEKQTTISGLPAFCHLKIFRKIFRKPKVFQEYHRSVNQFGSFFRFDV